MKREYAFSSERLFFRTLSINDTELMVKWRSDPKVYQYFKNPEPTSISQHLRWFEGYLQSNTRFEFIIFLKETNASVGFVSLTSLCNSFEESEIGYAIAEPQYQKMGFAKEAVTALMDFSNKTFSTKTYNAIIHKNNYPSVKLVLSLGYTIFCEDEFNIYKKNTDFA